MKCILVALDGSSCAEHALSYAIRVAKAEQASVELRAFVNPRAIVGRSLSEPLKEEHVAAAMIEARGMIAEAIRKASKAGIRASGRAELGEPAVEIVEHAKALGVGAIVMGTHGRSGFKRLFMGSVAEEVLRSASCPVIVIREKTAIEHVPPSRQLSKRTSRYASCGFSKWRPTTLRDYTARLRRSWTVLERRFRVFWKESYWAAPIELGF